MKENTYVEYPKHLRYMMNVYINFWRKQSLKGHLEDKGGSFNVTLYLDYLDAIREQPQVFKSKV
jgi:hypothetical protein